MDPKLIPYSVHLPPEVYQKLKNFAGQRKASSIVREAIIAFIEGGSDFDRGYQSGLASAKKVVANHKVAKAISYNGETISDLIVRDFK